MKEITLKKGLIFNLFSGTLLKVITIILNLLIVPITLNYFGNEQYGFLILILSIVNYINISNLGIADATNILLAKSRTTSKKIIIIKKSLLLLSISITISIFLTLLLNQFNINWIKFLGKIPLKYIEEYQKSVFILIVGTLVNMYFSLVDSIFYGFQLLYIKNIFDIFKQVINFIIIFFIIQFKLGIFELSLSIVAINFFINILKVIYLYITLLSKKIREETMEKTENYLEIMKLGFLFFSNGILAMLFWNTDSLIISNFIGLDSVASYSIVFKIFYIFISILWMFIGSIMPLVGREIANEREINEFYILTMNISSKIGAIVLVGTFFFMKNIIWMWVGNKIDVNIEIIFVLGLYCYVLSMSTVSSGFLRASNKIKGLPFITASEAILNLLVSITLVRIFGVVGVSIGTLIGALLTTGWIYHYLVKTRLKTKISFSFKPIIKQFILLDLLFIFIAIYLSSFNMNTKIEVYVKIFLFIIYILFIYLFIDNKIKNKLNEILLKKIRRK